VVVLTAGFGLFLLGRWLWWKFALKGWFCMKNVMKIVAVVALVLAVGVVLALKEGGDTPAPDAGPATQSTRTTTGESVDGPLPRLVSLGAGKCVPCKMMEPIREELREEYAGRLRVVYHDVWQDRAIGEQYGIRLIPTLIYFDADGNELGRTEGYKTKPEIIEAFRDWGVDLHHAEADEADGREAPDASVPAAADLKPVAAPANDPQKTDPAMTLGEAYPLLGDGPLGAAALTRLPAGRVLQAGEVAVTTDDLKTTVDNAQPQTRTKLKQQQLFLLEQLATQRLLAAEARRAGDDRANAPAADDQQVIQDYLGSVAGDVTISDREIRQFYQANSAMMGGAPLDQVRNQIRQYLLGQAQQARVTQHIEKLVRRADVQLDRQWVGAQAEVALDNPVDRIRADGKPAMIDFGSHGCGPCDMMTPILERLAKTYDGRAEILFVPVNAHPILAARYGVQGIPTQIFFDAEGREVHRHTGFLAQDQIESRLSQMGVR